MQTFEELQKRYWEIDRLQRQMSKEQASIRREMQACCPHDDLFVVEKDPMMEEMGLEDTSKKKCRKCFRYFY